MEDRYWFEFRKKSEKGGLGEAALAFGLEDAYARLARRHATTVQKIKQTYILTRGPYKA